MRPHCFAALSAFVVFVACEATAPPTRPARTVANARRNAGAVRNARHNANPPPVDSVRQCPREAVRVLNRYRQDRTIHFGPLCTDVFNGRFSAVLATGTRDEASDVWVIFHDTRGDEVHRVKSFPVGAKIDFGRISQGWVYLLGQSNALEDMPAGARLLAIFPLPRPGDTTPPEIGLLSPFEAPLLRASDVEELDRRLAFPVPPRDPSQRDATRTVTEIAQRGPNVLLDHLSPEGAPTLRAWQVGMFQETNYVSPQGDPTSPNLSRALAHIREVSRSMDCSLGDRCVARSDIALEAGAAPAQVFLRNEAQRIIVAALIAAADPPVRDPSAAREAWGPEEVGNENDVTMARSLTLDGEIQGSVVSATRGAARALAFQVSPRSGGIETRLYIVDAEHAPRPYTDASIGLVTLGSTALHLRDYERDGGLELVTVGRSRENTTVFSIASVDAPPSVSQHVLTQRLDMLRVIFGDQELRSVDAHLRGYRANPVEREVACATLDRVAGGDARAFAAATGATLAVIDYQEAWQPLRGQPRRIQRRELQQQGTAVLGPFANLHCNDLTCDWAQAICRIPGDQDRGVLWFADGGRRIAAVSLRP